MFRGSRALFVSPHTDDSELACGGTIARILDDGGEVFVVALSIARESLPPDVPNDTLAREFARSMKLLGVPSDNAWTLDYPVRRFPEFRQQILEELVSISRRLAPDLVFVPSRHDVHQDHGVVHAEARRALKAATIFGYELPWNTTAFATQALVSLSAEQLDRKWTALEAYETQVALGRTYFTRASVEAIARMRGLSHGCTFAEAFEVVRLRL